MNANDDENKNGNREKYKLLRPIYTHLIQHTKIEIKWIKNEIVFYDFVGVDLKA